jgi:hypothetical protein
LLSDGEREKVAGFARHHREGGCHQGVGGFLSRSRRTGPDRGDEAGRHRRTEVRRDENLLELFVVARCEWRLE